MRPRAASDPRQLPSPDLIILAIKAYDLDEVMAQIEPVLTDGTVILTLQNGIDTEDRIIERLKRDCVVGGVAFIYSKIAAPGVIDHYKKGAVAIGELMGHESERLLKIRDLFAAASIPCQLSKDIRRSKWEKMCWNCVFNPITVLIDDKVAKALDYPEMMGVIRQIVGEVTAVSAAIKVPLPADMPERVVKWTQEIRDIHTSMYDDWKAGRQTEIRSLNGYIVDQGRALGIPTPVNEALTAMIKTVTEQEKSGAGVVRIDRRPRTRTWSPGWISSRVAAVPMMRVVALAWMVMGSNPESTNRFSVVSTDPASDSILIFSGRPISSARRVQSDSVPRIITRVPRLRSRGDKFR